MNFELFKKIESLFAGVFKEDGPYSAYIDVNSVPELKQSMMDTSGVKIGANVSLSNAIDLLQKASEIDGYSYTAQISKHLKRVANVPVRNVSRMLFVNFVHYCVSVIVRRKLRKVWKYRAIIFSIVPTCRVGPSFISRKIDTYVNF